MSGATTKSRISLEGEAEAPFFSKVSMLHPKLSPSSTLAVEMATDDNPNVDNKCKIEIDEVYNSFVKNETILDIECIPEVLASENFVKDEYLLLNADLPVCIEESIPSNLLYNCYQCNYATNDLRNFTDHTFIHRYKCNLCSYTSFNNSASEQHKEIHFNVGSNVNLIDCHNNETLFKCNFCNYSSNKSKRLKSHLRIHSELSCNKCEYKCNNKAAMTYHIRWHINDNYIKCEFCDYCSNHSSKLKKHFENKHSGEKHFSCDKCDYKCRQKSALNNHKRTHIKTKSIKPNLLISEILNKVHQDFMKNKNNFNFYNTV